MQQDQGQPAALTLLGVVVLVVAFLAAASHAPSALAATTFAAPSAVHPRGWYNHPVKA